MINRYRFVSEIGEIICEFCTTIRIVPKKDQFIIVKGKEYTVKDVTEKINYDRLNNEIYIYL